MSEQINDKQPDSLGLAKFTSFPL